MTGVNRLTVRNVVVRPVPYLKMLLVMMMMKKMMMMTHVRQALSRESLAWITPWKGSPVRSFTCFVIVITHILFINSINFISISLFSSIMMIISPS